MSDDKQAIVAISVAAAPRFVESFSNLLLILPTLRYEGRGAELEARVLRIGTPLARWVELLTTEICRIIRNGMVASAADLVSLQAPRESVLKAIALGEETQMRLNDVSRIATVLADQCTVVAQRICDHFYASDVGSLRAPDRILSSGNWESLVNELRLRPNRFVSASPRDLSIRILKPILEQLIELTSSLQKSTSAFAATREDNPDQPITKGAVDLQRGWGHLVLPAELLESLQALTFSLRNIDELKRQGFAAPRALLLYGPPGTGKTEIARTVSANSGRSFFAASTADIKGGYLGQSGQNVAVLFRTAREAGPAIIFIDELDILAPPRGDSSDAYLNEVIGQLLQEMDGIQATPERVFVMGATNNSSGIDRAIAQRFPARYFVGLPDKHSRARLFLKMLSNKQIDTKRETAAEQVADLSEGMSGRDLRNVVDEAEQKAIYRGARSGSLQNLKIALADVVAIVERWHRSSGGNDDQNPA